MYGWSDGVLPKVPRYPLGPIPGLLQWAPPLMDMKSGWGLWLVLPAPGLRARGRAGPFGRPAAQRVPLPRYRQSQADHFRNSSMEMRWQTLGIVDAGCLGAQIRRLV